MLGVREILSKMHTTTKKRYLELGKEPQDSMQNTTQIVAKDGKSHSLTTCSVFGDSIATADEVFEYKAFSAPA